MLSMVAGSSGSIRDARGLQRETGRKGSIHACVLGEDLRTAKGGVSSLTLLDF